MSTYTVDRLARRGARHALALLLQHIRDGDEPFVTYGTIARFLEVKLKIPRVFPTHIGSVAGRMMDLIEEQAPQAPLINALVTRPSGIPGKGFGGYYDRRIRRDGERKWISLPRGRKIEVVAQVRAEVRRYTEWDALYAKLFGAVPPKAPKPKRYKERDGKPAETDRPTGKGESPEHKKLKDWAVKNPAALGLTHAFKGTPEMGLLSGDRIDVLFTDGASFVAVEVKSTLSTDDDLRRGVYQCVKYRAVVAAQESPVSVAVRTMLLTERELPDDLKTRARELGVMLKVHAINLPRSR
ncbi:MAG: hypothetical protein ACSLE1_11850 [Sphingobium sp.]